MSTHSLGHHVSRYKRPWEICRTFHDVPLHPRRDTSVCYCLTHRRTCLMPKISHFDPLPTHCSSEDHHLKHRRPYSITKAFHTYLQFTICGLKHHHLTYRRLSPMSRPLSICVFTSTSGTVHHRPLPHTKNVILHLSSFPLHLYSSTSGSEHHPKHGRPCITSRAFCVCFFLF